MTSFIMFYWNCKIVQIFTFYLEVGKVFSVGTTKVSMNRQVHGFYVRLRRFRGLFSAVGDTSDL